MHTLDQLQTRLGEVWSLNQPGCTAAHVVVALPSFSLAPSILAHYGPRLGPLEHRYLVSMLMLAHIPGCELVFVCSEDPGDEVVEYYAGLLPRPCGEASVSASTSSPLPGRRALSPRRCWTTLPPSPGSRSSSAAGRP